MKNKLLRIALLLLGLFAIYEGVKPHIRNMTLFDDLKSDVYREQLVSLDKSWMVFYAMQVLSGFSCLMGFFKGSFYWVLSAVALAFIAFVTFPIGNGLPEILILYTGLLIVVLALCLIIDANAKKKSANTKEDAPQTEE